eukprot:CAMPEP_0170592514 /NCGR_PEP_ID=MMETSP0224-20130122/12963_1 /TAXON_ID=285029 /ORGANISM="Togula jolla, Strain CCCM 725" /LENGTH=719 /DNA_ID=CAMNT_0010916421 /DNA_START=71 /DNA_END=2227 /DNA_ORIENTATION=-
MRRPSSILFYVSTFISGLFSSAVVAEAVLSGTNLRQAPKLSDRGVEGISAGRRHRHHENSAAFDNVHGVLSAVDSHIQALQAHLEESQATAHQTLANMKAEYEGKLREQSSEIASLVEENAAISKEVDLLEKNNDWRYRHASSLQTEVNNLRKNIKELQGTLSTMQDFTAETIDHANDVSAPELQVLKDLEEEDASRAAEASHREKLNEIANHRKRKVALLSVAGEPEELLKQLDSALAEIQGESSKSEAMLTSLFEEKFATGTSKITDLKAERERLNTTRVAGWQLRSKLEAAVKHLEETHLYLIQRSSSLRAFVQSFGERSQASQAPALLQISAQLGGQLSAQLPEYAELREKPSAAFTSLSAQIQDLESRLAAAQQANEEKLQSLRQSQAAVLANKTARVTAVQEEIDETSRRMKEVEDANSLLRSRAEALKMGNEKLRDDLRQTRLNLTTALEVTERKIRDANLTNEPEIAVLVELNKQDDLRRQEWGDQMRLHEIDSFSKQPQPLSFLSVSSRVDRLRQVAEKMGSNPEQLVRLLNNSFVELDEELAQTMASSNEAFSKRCEEEDQLYRNKKHSLSDLQKQVFARREAGKRLEAAVEHLNNTNSELSKAVKTMRAYTKVMGTIPLPGKLHHSPILEMMGLTGEPAVESIAQNESAVPGVNASGISSSMGVLRRAEGNEPLLTGVETAESENETDASEAESAAKTSSSSWFSWIW